jgi:hypothetical protein
LGDLKLTPFFDSVFLFRFQARIERVVFCLFLPVDVECYKKWLPVFFPPKPAEPSAPAPVVDQPNESLPPPQLFSYAEAVKHAAHDDHGPEDHVTTAREAPATGHANEEEDELMEMPSSESPVTDDDPPTDPLLDPSPPVQLTAADNDDERPEGDRGGDGEASGADHGPSAEKEDQENADEKFQMVG